MKPFIFKKRLGIIPIIIALIAIVLVVLSMVLASVLIGDRTGVGDGDMITDSTGGPSGPSGPAIPPPPGTCMNVPYVAQPTGSSWCGRASQSMVIEYFTKSPQPMVPLNVSLIRQKTGNNYYRTNDTEAAVQSIKSGYPVIVESDLGSLGIHIFVLVGYNEETQQFYANNTYGSQICVDTIYHVKLTKQNMANHIRPQGGPAYFVVR